MEKRLNPIPDVGFGLVIKTKDMGVFGIKEFVMVFIGSFTKMSLDQF